MSRLVHVSAWWLVVLGVLALPFIVAFVVGMVAIAALYALAVLVEALLTRRLPRRHYRYPRLTRHGYSVPWIRGVR